MLCALPPRVLPPPPITTKTSDKSPKRGALQILHPTLHAAKGTPNKECPSSHHSRDGPKGTGLMSHEISDGIWDRGRTLGKR